MYLQRYLQDARDCVLNKSEEQTYWRFSSLCRCKPYYSYCRHFLSILIRHGERLMTRDVDRATVTEQLMTRRAASGGPWHVAGVDAQRAPGSAHKLHCGALHFVKALETRVHSA